MENITLGQIVTAIAIITAIVGFIKLIATFVKIHHTDVIKDILQRLGKLEIKTDVQDEDIQDSKEERLLLMKGVLACLNGLHEQGCNNTVTSTIKDFEVYLQLKAHK